MKLHQATKCLPRISLPSQVAATLAGAQSTACSGNPIAGVRTFMNPEATIPRCTCEADMMPEPCSSVHVMRTCSTPQCFKCLRWHILNQVRRHWLQALPKGQNCL